IRPTSLWGGEIGAFRPPVTTLGEMLARLSFARSRTVQRWTALNALRGDAVLYGVSALFAVGLGWTSREAAQWHWGYLAVGTYVFASVAAWMFSRRDVRRTSMVRLGLLTIVV